MTLDRLYRDVENLKHQYKGLAGGPQLALSSIENGNIDVNDQDGNLVSTIGLQEDGSGATRFFDGPIPPVPAGFTALADGPVIQGTWDGSFVGGLQATYDLAYLEVAATLVDDDSRVSFATITAKEGASATLVANQSGQWAVAVRSVSQAGKKSEFFSAGTVEVKLVDLAGAIEAVQDSANGKNKVTYSEHAPTPDDPGIFDDTWFVGQVGRPNDVVEATNLARNSSFANLGTQMYGGTMYGTSNAVLSVSDAWSTSGSTSLKITPGTANTSTAEVILRGNPESSADAGKTFTISADFHLEEPQTGSLWADARKLIVRGAGNTNIARTDPAPNEAGTTRMSLTVTIPEGTTSWYLLLANGSSVTPAWWDSLDIAEVASPRPYFDGDTPSGETDNESHYRWTGTPHASTSEKYLPALDIGDSDNWNVIEQYRHDGTGWVKVELSHYVFSTVDLGKATVGELDGIRIMSKTIGTEQLRADFADFMVARGATLIAGNNRHRLDDSGYMIFNDDGEVRTKLAPDDSVFKGEVEADTLIVNGGSELRSAENKLGQGAKLTLEAGVTDPTAPPVVQTFWDTLDFDIPNPDTCYGLAWADNKYWTYVDVLGTTAGDRVVSINPTTGAVGGTIPMTDGFWAEGGITAMGSELFLLGRKSGENYKYFVRVYSTAGTFLREWEYKEVGWSASNPLGYKPCIGASSTRIYIAHCDDGGQLIWRTYDKTTGALMGTVNTGYPTSSDLLGAYIGEGDWGVGDRVAIVKKTTRQVIVLTPSGSNEPALRWNTPSDTTGIVYQGGKFRTLDPNGSITNYEDAGMGDNTSDWWATYRWSVDEDENGVNDYTSRIGPVKRFYWDRRTRVRFMGAPLPVGVGYITPSIAKKTSTPSRTDFRTPTFSVYVGEATAWLSALPSDWQSGPPPGDTNDFPDSEPSTLVSASSTFEVKGDGSGRWGPLTFNSDGTMSSSQVPTWIPITSFSSIPSDEGGGTYGPQSWGDTPSYRIWPDGKVEWRGVIAGTVGGGATASRPMFTIPAAALPGRPKNKATAASGSTPVRVEFGPTADVGKFYVYPSGGARSWVSIDELFYYLP